MFQLDDNFLEEVGLGSLPDDQKGLFLNHFREQLELRVGLQLSEGLSDMQLGRICLPRFVFLYRRCKNVRRFAVLLPATSNMRPKYTSNESAIIARIKTTKRRRRQERLNVFADRACARLR